ncbi:MAG TPA: alpha/beta hydrolase [Bacteroidales bacterium]|nr:alpha/beta hydrolase [Bacteroidales bacterium]HPS15612.1 alpha/beta hydrolase [Bacteroidales bacterium]
MKRIAAIICIFATYFSAQALNPSRTYSVSPSDYGMTYEEVSITTEDNVTLFGWFFKTTEASTKVMIMSDDGNGNMADNFELASNFITLGYNVLMYDYRGYGKSSDFTINNNFFIYAQFQKDIEAAIDYIKKYQAKLRSINLYGIGIGAGLSLSVGANHAEITKIIADSPYNNFENMKKVIKEINGADALFPLAYNKNYLEPTYALESKGGTLAGIFFIAGENENIFNQKIAKELSKIRSSISSTYIVKGATMSTTFSSNKSKYFDEISNFLK